VYRLASDCARDEVVRKFVAPALELIMLDKALDKASSTERRRCSSSARCMQLQWRETARWSPKRVELTVGGELGGGAALLRLAVLHLLNQLLPDELKFNARIYVKKDRYYNITA
jgi:dissimilatory sulfite reductase (desulfoviridin) alpha/beta subunit